MEKIKEDFTCKKDKDGIQRKNNKKGARDLTNEQDTIASSPKRLKTTNEPSSCGLACGHTVGQHRLVAELCG